MKSFITLPTAQDFYDRYAALIHTLNRTTPLTQIISAATEIGVIYSVTYKAINQVLPAYALPLAITCAVLGTALLEIGLRVLFPYGWRAILYGRFKGLDLLMTIVILAALGMLATASGALSFSGGKEAVINNMPPPELDTTTEAEELADKDRATTLATFRADSAQIAQRYAAQVEATGASYEAQASAARGKVQYYRQREAITGQSFASAKAKEAQRSTEMEAEKAQAIAQLRAEEAAELRTIATARATALASITGTLAEARTEITTGNKATEEAHLAKTNGIGLGVGWFTLICLFYFGLVTLLYEAMKKGSGIEDKPAPNHYIFAPGILAEASGAVSERWNYWTRNAIQRFADGTPPPPLPAHVKSLYNLSGILATGGAAVQLEVLEEDTTGGKVLRIPRRRDPRITATGGTGAGTTTAATEAQLEALETKALHLIGVTHALERDNYHNEAAPFDLEAREVIRQYLGPGHTDEEFAELYNGCCLFMNGAGPNPFEKHHRRNPIGFTKASASDPGSTGNKKEWPSLCTCGECGKDFVSEEHGRRFCDDCETRAAYGNAPANDHRYNGHRYTVETKHEKGGADHRQRQCKHCGNTFTYKHWNKQYCSDQCRLDFHAAQHGGTRFDPAEYRKGKKKQSKK